MAKRKRVPGKIIRSAVVGYGPWCNMGKLHCTTMSDHPAFELQAVCDTDPARTAEAERDFPAIETYTSLARMLRRDDIDLVTVVVPHDLHARIACKCLRAGKHVIVEKPMAIRASQCTRMIEQANDSGVMLTCFQNRRLDGDYLALQQVIRDDLLGQVFHIEAFHGAYWVPPCPWRNVTKICGGPLHDWGAHYVDWVLGLVPAKVASVTGFLHKQAWPEIDMADEGQAVVRFANGAVGDITISRLAFIGKARWLIRGSQGTLTDGQGDSFRLKTLVKGREAEIRVPYQESRWGDYYGNVADHLLRGTDLLVQPEESRRVVGVIEAAMKSARSGKPASVPHE
jgi:predicted dehydrogenase